jgi:tetratricopeptide (TPR) repeat protein
MKKFADETEHVQTYKKICLSGGKAKGFWPFALCALLFALTYAQVTITPIDDAASLLEQAERAAGQAKTAYASYNVDQPHWKDAMRLGEEAYKLEPNNPEITLFLAQTYSSVNWFSRAWDKWTHYLRLSSFEQAPEEIRYQFAEVGNELGFARYQSNDLTGALEFYNKVNDHVPDYAETLRWLGRIYLELGQPDKAQPYWQRVTELDPDDQSASYYVKIIDEQLRVGPEASSMFQAGIKAYDEGKLPEALQAFEWAATANPTFKEAYVWAARTSFELGESDLSAQYWQKVLALDPSDERAAYFAQFAQEQQHWGQEAARAFYEGQTFYQQQNIPSALERFEAATRLNSQYKDAFVWTARTYQELGQLPQAAYYWQKVIALDPSDSRAKYFLTLTQKQEVYGDTAGQSFADGVQYYQKNDFANAEASFKKAIDANASFADAWAWLGRVYFTQAKYAEASKAYTQAVNLAPNNQDYRFFANEAKRLAGN